MILRRIIIFQIISLLLCLPSTAQRKVVPANQQNMMVAEIEKASARLKTFECDFVQTKQLSILNDKLISHGHMYYSGGKSLRWEYTSPYHYTFIVNGTKVKMKDSRGSQTVDVKSSKLFQGITRIMLKSMTGSCLSEREDFRTNLYTEGNEWVAVMVPLKKEMRQLFQTITLYYSTRDQMVRRVELKERTGDEVGIELTKLKKNVPIGTQIFQID